MQNCTEFSTVYIFISVAFWTLNVLIHSFLQILLIPGVLRLAQVPLSIPLAQEVQQEEGSCVSPVGIKIARKGAALPEVSIISIFIYIFPISCVEN